MKEKYNISGMSCAACQAHVNNAVSKLEGISSCNVNLLLNNMEVNYDEAKLSSNDIIEAVNKAGYGASLIGNEKTTTKEVLEDKTIDNKLKKLIISIIFLLLIMYVSMGHMMLHFPIPDVFNCSINPVGFALIQFILALVIIFIYKDYYISGYIKLFKKASNMDTLIAIGSSFSLVYGIFALFMISYGVSTSNTDLVNRYKSNLYFESSAMILVFVSIGKYLEGLSKKKTTKAIEKLMDLAPKTAILLKDDKEIEVDVNDVLIGDIIICKKGSNIPLDGIIIEGGASINEANITGESLPVYKSLDNEVYASSIIESGYIKIKANKLYEDSSIANIIKLVNEASNSKAPISKLADKISGIFVPTILSISTLVFIINFLVVSFTNFNYINTGAFETALNFAITVIVIACPCALGLATPVAIMVGVGKGASNGLLIKNAEILEKAQYIDTIVFDKTGTITKGEPTVTDYIVFENINNLDDILYSFESKSEHPLALSITKYFKQKNIIEIDEYKSLDGKGIVGKIKDDTYFIGNNSYAKELNISSKEIEDKLDELSLCGKTSLVVIKNNNYVAILAIKDEIKESSAKAIKLLKEANLNVVMLTGDNFKTASVIANEIGVNKVIAEVLPTTKAEVINSLKKDDKHLVCMVGDGVNDALALTSADLSIAIGAGSDVALESSDIVLLRNDLIDVYNVYKLSKRVLNTIKLGLFFAFFYNIICVIIATGVFYYITRGAFKMVPMYGAIAMSISSVSVVLNALTINFFKGVKINNDNEIIIKVKGMMCNKCVKHVEEACLKVEGVASAKASLENKNVIVTTNKVVDKNELINNIINAGYKAR